MNCLLGFVLALEVLYVSGAVMLLGHMVGTGRALAVVAALFAITVTFLRMQFWGKNGSLSEEFSSDEVSQHAHVVKRFARMARIKAPELRLQRNYGNVSIELNTKRDGLALTIGDYFNRRLSAKELVPVLAHEFGHLIAGDIFWFFVTKTSTVFFSVATLFFVVTAFFGVAKGHVAFSLLFLSIGLLFAFGAMFLLDFLLEGIKEYRADAIGALLSGEKYRLADSFVRVSFWWDRPAPLRYIFFRPGDWLTSSRVQALRVIFRS